MAEVRVEPSQLAIVAVVTTPARRSAVADAIGAAVPAPGRSTTIDGIALSAVGPDRWIARGPGDGPALAARLAARLGSAALIADQTDAWAAFRVAGAGSRAALARLSSIDLHPRAFPEDGAVFTEIAGIPALIAAAGPDAFLIAGIASAGADLGARLAEAARSAETGGPDAAP